MADDFPLPLDGGCRCGAIRYRVTAAPLFSFMCHCTDCQKLSSSAFSLGLAAPESGFELTGQPREWDKTADSGKTSRQFTCPVCATWTHTTTERSPGVVVVRPSTLDDHRWVRPVAQIFTRSALPWAMQATALTYETEFEDVEPLKRVFAESAIRP